MKLVILDAHGVNPGDISWEQLKPLGDVEIYEETADGADEQATIDRIDDCDIVVTCKNVLGRKTFEQCKNIKMVAVLSPVTTWWISRPPPNTAFPCATCRPTPPTRSRNSCLR